MLHGGRYPRRSYLHKCWWPSVKRFLVAGGQISPFPIDFHRRPYNTLALPCECVILNANSCRQKAVNPNRQIDIFVRIILYLFCALGMRKRQFSNGGFYPREFEFSPIAKFRDILTADDVIGELICISTVECYRVLQCKYSEIWYVVLWFTVLKKMTIFLSPTPKLSFGLSSERLTLWRHFWSYCRVTKSLPSLFCYAT